MEDFGATGGEDDPVAFKGEVGEHFRAVYTTFAGDDDFSSLVLKLGDTVWVGIGVGEDEDFPAAFC